MNINGLQVDRFGVWTDFSLGELPDDVTVFYGPNEAGKSTLMNFIRTMLFGFSADKCQRFVTGPLGQSGGRMGGRLTISGYEGQFYVKRHADQLEPLANPGEVKVTTIDGARVGTHKLASLLSGIDEAIYNNVFCVGMFEIQRLSSLNDTQAAQFLYSLSTGTDRVSLVDVMRQLRAARMQLVGNGKPGLLTDLIRRRDEQRRTVEQLGRLTENWGQLRAELASRDQDIKRLEAKRDDLSMQTRTLEVAAGLRPKWLRRKELAAEIASLGPAPVLPNGIFERLSSVDERISQRQRETEALKQRREMLMISEKDLDVNDDLQRNFARAKALLDQREWISTLDEQVRRLESRTEEIDFEIQAEMEKLGVAPTTDGRNVMPQIDTQTLSALRAPARLVKLSKKRLETAKREATEHKAEADRIGQEITQQLGGKAEWLGERDRNDVTKLMEKTGSVTADLRRRSELTRATHDMSEQLEAVELRRKRYLERQFLPRPVIVALATVFAIGSILLLSAIFGTGTLVSESRQGFLFVLGGLATGAAVGWKLLLDNTHKGALKDCESQRRDLNQRLATANEEIESIEAALPSGHSMKQYDKAEGLDDLEQIMPLDTQRRQALEQAALAEKRAIDIATSMKEGHLQWEKALAALGLPTRLSPNQVRQLAGRSGNLTFLRRQSEDAHDQLERARRELAAVQGRILDLMTQADVQPTSQRPLEQLEQLRIALRDQELQVSKRNDIRRQTRKIRRQENRIAAAIRRLDHKRTTLFTSANATDEDDLRRLDERRQQVTSLVRQHDNLNEEITATLSPSAHERLIREQLEKTGGEQLKQRLQQTQRDSTRAEQQLKELLQQRGELSQQLKTLVQNRQLPEAHIQLAIIEKKLRDGLSRWKELSATTHLLRRVYKRYEKDRQPETLQHASEFLQRMTGERYTRIWTPLAEDVLLIDDSQGNSLPIEVLSRGTREQVFLSLRLALVSGYARRGVRMPMVLDDVLVNFDVDRTVAAAEVLVEFARAGHQILVFTCHDHIVRVFQDLDVELRDLPRREVKLAVPKAPAATLSRPTTPNEQRQNNATPVSAAATSSGGSFLGDMMLPSMPNEAAVEQTEHLPSRIQPSPSIGNLPVTSPRHAVTAGLESRTESVASISAAKNALVAALPPQPAHANDANGTSTTITHPHFDTAEKVASDGISTAASEAPNLVEDQEVSPSEDTEIEQATESQNGSDDTDDHADGAYDEDVAHDEEPLDEEEAYDEDEADDEDVEYEYEYVDENGDPIDEEQAELEDDGEYEWVEVDEESLLDDEAA